METEISGSAETRRLLWRCRRGLLELDIVLQRFLEAEYSGLAEQDKRCFRDLLEVQDNALLEYLHDPDKCPDLQLKQFINKYL
ncbi:MAG: succinate dehydrogenase assembly factor 2 [Gammaproteobacteria bacterium]|nr:MAG: succinate dehydrogenase assembly factor 2 [Gammaproteobacteria bacterium]